MRETARNPGSNAGQNAGNNAQFRKTQERRKAGESIMRRKRYLAAVLAGIMLMTVFMFAGIFALCMEHECIGEGCSRCAQIRSAKEAVDHIISAGGSVLCLLLPLCCQILKAGKYSNPCVRGNTLIQLKVKLSN